MKTKVAPLKCTNTNCDKAKTKRKNCWCGNYRGALHAQWVKINK